MEVISKEEFFEIMKTACVDELKSIMAAQQEMTKEGGALSEGLAKLLGSGSRLATRNLRGLAGEIPVGQMARTTLRGARGAALPAYQVGERAAPGALANVRRGGPFVPSGYALPGAVPMMEGAAGAAGAGLPSGMATRLPWYQTPGFRRALSYGALPIGGAIVGGAFGHPFLGAGLGLGAAGLAAGGGALSRMGKTTEQSAMSRILGSGMNPDEAAKSLAMLKTPEAQAYFSRLAGPRLGTGLAAGIPVALGGTYMLGKDILGGITGGGDQQGGGGMGTIPGLAMAGLGGYGGYQLGDMLSSQMGLPDWTKYLGAGLGAFAAPRLAGGMF